MTGTSHKKNGHCCDDAHAYRQQSNGTLLLAAADGAGSAAYASMASVGAVHAALNAAETALAWQNESNVNEEERLRRVLSHALEAARSAVEALASRLPIVYPDPASPDGGSSEITAIENTRVSPESHVLREFATTLLLVVVTTQWVAILQVGDGAVVTWQVDEMLYTVTIPEHGEYLNETCFITDPDYLQHAQYVIYPQETVIQGVALLTDGLESLALDHATNIPYEPFFKPLFKFAAQEDTSETQLAAFLDSERICARTDDDKTLVLTVRLS